MRPLAAPRDLEIDYFRDSAPPELVPLDTVDDLPALMHVPATNHPTMHPDEIDSLTPPCSGRCIITGQLTSNRWFPKRPRRDDDVGSSFPHSFVSLGLLSPDAGAGFSHYLAIGTENYIWARKLWLCLQSPSFPIW